MAERTGSTRKEGGAELERRAGWSKGGPRRERQRLLRSNNGDVTVHCREESELSTSGADGSRAAGSHAS